MADAPLPVRRLLLHFPLQRQAGCRRHELGFVMCGLVQVPCAVERLTE